MTDDLRENCKLCLQHYRERERLRGDVNSGTSNVAADLAVENDQSHQPSDLTTVPATDTLEAAGESQVDDSQVTLARAEESQAEESQAGA